MTIVNTRFCLLLATLTFITGCGKQEKNEALLFGKAIAAKKAGFAAATNTERDLVNNARIWCGQITGNGAGRGAELDKNSAVATQLAKVAVEISAQLSQVRQAIDDQPLKEEFTRNLRAEMTTELTRRQRTLQDIRAQLEQAAPQFLDYKKAKGYAGDTYPDGVAKLNSLLGSYKVPEDPVGTALASLKSKYGFTDADF
jgi:hypothetical protein